MKAMQSVTIDEGGRITLPEEALSKSGLAKRVPLRVIATRSGILLVPLTEEPMSKALAEELESWQSIGAESLDAFRFDEESAP